jgi:protocatechuate 3,4-dioxygenase beta subunit
VLGYKLLAGLTTLALGAVMTVTGLDSGPKVGDNLSAFEPSHVSGADAGTETCPVCKYGNLPAVQVWVNGGPNQQMAKLASNLDKQMAQLNRKDLKFKSFMIFKGEGAKLESELARLAKAEALSKVALTWVPGNSDALELYKINPEAKTTVLVYKNRRVTEKFVNIDVEKDIKALNEAINKIVR